VHTHTPGHRRVLCRRVAPPGSAPRRRDLRTSRAAQHCVKPAFSEPAPLAPQHAQPTLGRWQAWAGARADARVRGCVVRGCACVGGRGGLHASTAAAINRLTIRLFAAPVARPQQRSAAGAHRAFRSAHATPCKASRCHSFASDAPFGLRTSLLGHKSVEGFPSWLSQAVNVSLP